MPTINLPKKKKDEYVNDDYKYVYNTTTWKKLRIEKLKENPICEMCIKDEKISAGEHIHHIIYLSSTHNIFEKKQLGFDYNNLMTLCKICHQKIHNRQNEKY